LNVTASFPAAVSRPHATSARLLAAAFAISVFGLLVSPALAVLGDTIALAVCMRMVFLRPPRTPASIVVTIGAYTLIAIYLFDAMGTNWPGIYPAVLGLRKSLPPWLFLLGGLSWPAGEVRRVIRSLTTILALAVALSLVIHRFAPGIEATIVRAASSSTAEFQGQNRLQGVFAGPFHVALACLLLLAVAVTNPAGLFGLMGRVAIGSLAVLGLVETSVRSGLVAALLVCVVGVVGRPTSVQGAARVARASLVGLTLVALSAINFGDTVFRHNAALESLRTWSSDQRLANRLVFYEQAKQLFEQRPVLGWGAGSAGDTLDRYFVSLQHVTPHNLLIKYAVETGAVGAVAVLAMIVAVGIGLWKARLSSTYRVFGLSVGAGFLAFGATGSAVDAVPISGMTLLFVGLALSGAAHPVEAAAPE
jgi:O-antigen ligase